MLITKQTQESPPLLSRGEWLGLAGGPVLAVVWEREREEVWSGLWQHSTCCVFTTKQLLTICLSWPVSLDREIRAVGGVQPGGMLMGKGGCWERWGDVVVWIGHTFCHPSGTFQLSVATNAAVEGWWRVCPYRPLIHIHSCAQWHVSYWRYHPWSQARGVFSVTLITEA